MTAARQAGCPHCQALKDDLTALTERVAAQESTAATVATLNDIFKSEREAPGSWQPPRPELRLIRGGKS